MTQLDLPPASRSEHFLQAIAAVSQTLERLRGCRPEERDRLQHDLAQLERMHEKLRSGRVEIVVFGEISTGKSALINALIGRDVAAVDVRGGWTKEVWHLPWDGCGYCVPGFEESQVVLIDTPGLNEVGGQERADIACEAAKRADVILFVTDSDLNETEFSSLTALVSIHKPIILVFNKTDLYSPPQRARLLEVLRDERLAGMVPPEDIVQAAADPREVEFVVEAADGSTRSEWRRPNPDIQALKSRLLEVLERDGLALVALNAAMYAADKSDRVATLRVQLREKAAQKTIWSYAVIKSAAVALNPLPVADAIGGTAVDITMVVTLSSIYGLSVTWAEAKGLVSSIAKAAGWVVVAELGTHLAATLFKALTAGFGTVLTAIPQGAAAGYGSYIVGQAAKYYFEHGSSWGAEGPKTVVRRILAETDKDSVLARLKSEIERKLDRNPHSSSPA